MAFFWRRNKEDKFSSSVLGLDRSIEELKAREEAAERELGVRFTKAIEECVRRHPEQWLWIHKRWRTRPAGEPDLYNFKNLAAANPPAVKIKAEA